MRDPVSRADLIVASMQDALLRELTNALLAGGPGFAMKSCHIDVIGSVQRIGREERVAAGRTSDRLRSPTNAPRPWAAELVAAQAGRRARDVPSFAVDLGDRVGVLRPIAQRPMCAACHGAPDTLDPAVRAELRDRYPRDQAVSFANGEIRGWFWGRGAEDTPISAGPLPPDVPIRPSEAAPETSRLRLAKSHCLVTPRRPGRP